MDGNLSRNFFQLGNMMRRDNAFVIITQGRNIGIENLRPGQLVRINHANFQTASIPPQTTAFSIQVL